MRPVPVDLTAARESLPPLATALHGLLASAGVDTTAWLVGGVVRDALLGRPLPDVDIAVAGDAEPAARALARALAGAAFPLGDDHGCWRVTVTPERRASRDAGALGACLAEIDQVDVCTLRGATIADDLLARDFTVNAMAMAIAPDEHATAAADAELLDPTGGMDDLRAGTLRMVAASAFDDDPLRMLRAVRLAHVLGLAIDEPTVEAIRARAARAIEPAGERLGAELCAMLLHPEARRALRMLGSLGLEAVLLPELHACRGVEQSRFHHLDVHEHTLAVLDNCEDVLAATGFWLPLPSEPGLVAEPWSDHQRLVVLLAAICHDLAKPETRRPIGDDRVSFAGHDALGADHVDRVCERFRLSGAVRTSVRRLVQTHLELGFLLHGPRDDRARWRFRRTVAPDTAEAVVLSVGDRLATAGPDDRRRWMRSHLELARAVWADHWRTRRDGVPVPLLDGREVAAAAGTTPGPAVGVLVERLAEEQAVGAVRTREEAEAFVREAATDVALSESTDRSTSPGT